MGWRPGDRRTNQLVVIAPGRGGSVVNEHGFSGSDSDIADHLILKALFDVVLKRACREIRVEEGVE